MMDRPRSADRCTKAPYTSCANARPARPRRIPRISDTPPAASRPYLNILICLPRDPPADIRGRMRSRTASSIWIPRLAPLRDATYAAGSRVQVLPFLVRIALGAYPVSFAWTISILQEINPSGSVFWPDVSFDDAHSRGESGSSGVLPVELGVLSFPLFAPVWIPQHVKNLFFIDRGLNVSCRDLHEFHEFLHAGLGGFGAETPGTFHCSLLEGREFRIEGADALIMPGLRAARTTNHTGGEVRGGRAFTPAAHAHDVTTLDGVFHRVLHGPRVLFPTPRARHRLAPLMHVQHRYVPPPFLTVMLTPSPCSPGSAHDEGLNIRRRDRRDARGGPCAPGGKVWQPPRPGVVEGCFLFVLVRIEDRHASDLPHGRGLLRGILVGGEIRRSGSHGS